MRQRQKMVRQGRLMSGAALAAMVAAAGPAWAEMATATDEVVVIGHKEQARTGTKSDAPLVETPVSISVIDGDRMDLLGQVTVNQALRYTAGITPETRGGVVTRYDQFTLRGFAVNNVFYNGLSGMYAGWYAMMQPDVSTLERVEVLKGPASVLYGTSGPGGLINLVGKKPVADPVNSVELSVGTRAYHQLSADLGGALDEQGKVLYRVVATGREGDGQARHTENERVSLAPSLTVKAGEDTSITLLGLYQRDPKSDGYGGVPAVGSVLNNPLGKVSVRFYDGEPAFDRYNRTQVMAGYQLEHRFSDVFSVEQNLRWQEVDSFYRQVYSGTLASDNRTLSRGSVYSIEDTSGVGVDTVLKAKFNTGPVSHNALAGLDYQNTDASMEIGYGTAGSIDVFNPVYGTAVAMPAPYYDLDIDQKQTGLYLQDQMKLGNWVLLAGLRHDWYKQSTKNTVPAPAEEKVDQGKTTYRVGLLHHFDSGFAPYISYSQSFEPESGVDFSGKTFSPTNGDQLEGGVKYESRDQRTLVTLSVFELTRDKIKTTDPDHPSFSIQTGEARSRGVELEGRLGLTETLEVNAAYTHLDMEYTKDNSGLKGKTPVAVADDTASLWLYNRFEEGALQGLGLGGGVRYVGKSWGDAENSFRVPSYTLVDLALRYDLARLSDRFEGWRFDASINNLFDKTHVTSCYSASWCWYGATRTVQAGLRKSW
ncbi:MULTISPECIES: TonB-dependent siderophore receptor [unclassified Azospirillum]|uniref:TonB-dependent siderophore receptor n=1 Tax=unclassified Azospirillum TaxID=2630922 RepID=UPI000B652A96|nr:MULTISPECIES: TonB-dependent siderophore receptor [unclassified Azospirillum]SNS24989.1 iron complex outermembrane recepter protein [Azospirillum sp. RU38E]SNS43444.1 iron complex outermembrane recepter protein [Azospirillum sp. RU37A]